MVIPTLPQDTDAETLAQSIERLGDVLDASAVLENPEVVIADGSDDREICGNSGHHQKIHH